jgi:acyl-CoA reductase-like NAD-dependent aldehyde dehydrogenase
LASSAFKLQTYENGCCFSGTLFDRADRYMTIYWEETFGPVLSVLRVRAMTRIVAHELGNGAAMFTRDVFADKIEAGMVGTNVADPGPGSLSFLRRLEAVDFRRSLHSPA